MNGADIVRKNVERLMREQPSCSTQQKLADKSGLGKTTVGRVLRSEAIPNVSTLDALAKAFSIHPSELLVDPDMSPEERSRPISGEKALELLAPFVSSWSDDDFYELIGALKAYRKFNNKK